MKYIENNNLSSALSKIDKDKFLTQSDLDNLLTAAMQDGMTEKELHKLGFGINPNYVDP